MEATPYAKTSPHATGCLQDTTNGQVIFFGSHTTHARSVAQGKLQSYDYWQVYLYGLLYWLFLMIVQDCQLGICICLIVTRFANIVTHANLPETLLPGKYYIPLLIVAVSD